MRVWDLPLRTFHWGLVFCVFAAIGSAKADVMWAHERFGLTIMALVAFRIIWGFVGGHHARFVNFVRSPLAVMAYLRKSDDSKGSHPAGHNPLGAYSVLALLAIAGAMAGSGVFSNDGILFDGPLAHLVPDATNTASKVHHRLQFGVFALVALHIGAIIFYRWPKRQHLTSAMVTGRSQDAVTGADGGISLRHTLAGFALMIILLALAHALPELRPSYF